MLVLYETFTAAAVAVICDEYPYPDAILMLAHSAHSGSAAAAGGGAEC